MTKLFYSYEYREILSNNKCARTDATVEPLAMMVKLGDAAIASRTVLGAERPPQETRAAELLR